MKIVKAYAEILTPLNSKEILEHIELCGRVCYKSESRATKDSALQFVGSLIEREHESVLEHFSFSVRFVCDRGVSHEIVRHRIASFSQESTRYCNYLDGCTFIDPCGLNLSKKQYDFWVESCALAELHYTQLLLSGYSAQQARAVLPSSIKTELIMTANLREWRHFFKLRCSIAAHPQMREITIPLLKQLKGALPVVFDDIEV